MGDVPMGDVPMGDVPMRSHRRQARLAGVLYIIATGAIVASGPFVGSIDSLEFLTEAAADENQVMLGTLFCPSRKPERCG